MMTDAEKAELAAHLRSTTVVETELPQDLVAHFDDVTCEETFVDTRVGKTRVVVVTPRGATGATPLFVNIHGGGFVRGYQKRDTMFCAMLASRLGCRVVDLDYRLSPEHPFPTALTEGYDVLQWCFRHATELSVDPQRIALGGHSAGGNLTAAICLMALRDGGRLPCLQILDYPFLDAVTPPEEKINGEPSVFTPERLQAFNDLHVPDPADRLNMLMSPVFAPPEMLAQLPAALIITAGLDPLRHEAERYARMLLEAGVELRLRRYPDSDHGFLIANLADFRSGHDLILRALREAFAH